MLPFFVGDSMKNKHSPNYKKPWWLYIVELVVVVAGVLIVAYAGRMQYQCMTNGYDIGKLAPRTLQPMCERHLNGTIEFEYLDTVLYKAKSQKVQ